MATFKDRINNYIDTHDDNTLSEWLTNGGKIVCNLLSGNELMLYATKSSVSISGVDIKNKRIVLVIGTDKSSLGYTAYEITAGDEAKVLSNTSIYKATERNPRWMIKENKLYIHPNGGIIYFLEYPVILYNDSDVNLPIYTYDIISLYAAIQEIIYKINDAVKSINDLNYTYENIPIAPETPNFVYNDASGTTVTNTTIDISSIQQPIYNMPISGVDYNNVEQYIGIDEDIEKATSEISHINSKLNEFNQNINNEENKYQESSAIYLKEIENKILNAKLLQEKLLNDAQRTDQIELANKAKDLEKQISEYINKLNNFKAEIELYNASIQEKTIIYSNNINKINSTIQPLEILYKQLRQQYDELIKVHFNI